MQNANNVITYMGDKQNSWSFVVSLLRYLTFRNFSISDNGIVDLLVAIDGAPITSISTYGVTLMGHGR